MKKLLFMVCACMMAVSSYAQKWETYQRDGDELLGRKPSTMESYTVGDFSIVVMTEEGRNEILLHSESYVFDYEYMNYHGNICEGKCGFYDINNNLIENKSVLLKIKNTGQSNIASLYSEVPTIYDFIKNGKGYIRFYAVTYGNNPNFDVKAPCIKNPTIVKKGQAKKPQQRKK